MHKDHKRPLVGAAVCAASAAASAALLAAVTSLPVAFLISAAIAGSVIAWALLDAAHDRTPPPPPPPVTDQSPWAGAHDFWLRFADRAERRGDAEYAAQLRCYAEQAADRARNQTETS